MPGRLLQEERAICKGGESLVSGGQGGGIFLPLLMIESVPLQIFLYLFTLLWMFLGVSIIADIFMSAIEKITSQQIQRADKNGMLHWHKIWNPTVANLTLMALGSSAPEILLSIIELIPSDFHSGDLGPSTIVGSAAFNLLVIIAVCVVALPPGDTRTIKEIWVFAITAFFSVFAYLWLVIILSVSSPNIVEFWEALVTLLYFPLMVGLAYLADVGKLQKMLGVSKGKKLVLTESSTPEEQAEMRQRILEKYGYQAEERLVEFMKYEFAPPPSRAVLRVQACRAMTGGKQVVTQEDQESFLNHRAECLQRQPSVVNQATVNLNTSRLVCRESDGKVTLKVQRDGNPDTSLSVRYFTEDGTALKVEDYIALDGVLDFKPQEMEKPIQIEIVEDKGYEHTEEFYLNIEKNGGGPFEIGEVRRATIVILDDDSPGFLAFEMPQFTVEESTKMKNVKLKVVRKGGCTGKIGFSYYSEDSSAISKADYELEPGTIELDNGQTTAFIPLKIMPKGRYENTECFRVIMHQPTGHATLDPDADGFKDEKNIATVTIQADAKGKTKIDAVRKALANDDKVKLGTSRWKDQFKEAVFVGGSYEEQQNATKLEYVLHFFGLPWKVIFALVPPTDFANGTATFFCALVFIGICTAFISDLANLLGCAMSFKAELCAITIVALGTSLPDTFASKSSAIQDPTADNSIGNVTGSNSVNVFLGLGLPWTVASLVWAARSDARDPSDPYEWNARFASESTVADSSLCTNGCFVVLAGELGINVVFFCVAACICIAVLLVRRAKFGAELGGDKGTAYATAGFFVFLWLAYVVFNMRSGVYENW